MSFKNMDMPKGILRTALLASSVACGSAEAFDVTWSGFGTLGYAQSDQAVKYQRFIDDNGTVKRDTVFGAQVDARFSQQWGATLQAKVAPSDHRDNRWQASLAWAFLSWRPSDDWLIRAGKLRLPFMLNTENADVGATYDFVRLPQEVYSIAPTTDILGLSISKTWLGDTFDWTAEAYTGSASTYWRYYGRDRTMNSTQPGSWFLPIDIRSTGLVLTARSLSHVFRIGYHEGESSRPGEKTRSEFQYGACPAAIPSQPCYNLAPGGVDRQRVPILTFGASVTLPQEFRLTGEFAKMRVSDSASRGLSRWGGYLALSRRIGSWVPYGYFAKVKSQGDALSLYQRVDANADVVHPAFRSYQHLIADLTTPYDQSTVAAGTSFWVTPNSVVKAEWSRVSTGVASSFLDAPQGGGSGDRRFNVFSLSYGFTF